MGIGPVVAAGGVVGMFGICCTLLLSLVKDGREDRALQGVRILQLEDENRRCARNFNLLVVALNHAGIAIPGEVWNDTATSNRSQAI